MSSGEANRQLRHDLLSILEPSGKLNPNAFIPSRGVPLATRPYGTQFEGVCRRDIITIRYVQVPAGASSADVPIRPYGVDARQTFHIFRLPGITEDMGYPKYSLAEQPVCMNSEKTWREGQGADQDEDKPMSWFEAQDAFHPVQAGFLLDMALKAIKAGTLKVAPCPDVVKYSEKTCEALIDETGGLARMDSVETCPAEAGLLCYRIMFVKAGAELTITAKGDDESPVPSRILSVAVDNYIITT